MGSSQWLQILIYLLVFAAPAIGWIYRKVKEQSAKKMARERQKTLEYDSLRETQVVERTSHADEQGEAAERQRAMRELAMRRQAQLQELRQRQLEAARQRQSKQSQRGPDPSELSTLVNAPGTARPTPQGQPPAPMRRGPGPQRATGQAPTRTPAPVIPPTQRRREAQQPNTPSQQREIRPRTGTQNTPIAPKQPVSTVPTISADRQRSDRLGVRAMLFSPEGKARPKEDLRRLLALNEVLSKPVSMRRAPGFDSGL